MFGRLNYAKDIFKLALPIILGNIGFIMIGVGDVIVAGRHSTDTLAAISIATAVTNTIMIFGIGILSGISSILSNYRGKAILLNKYLFPTMKFSIILAFVTSLMIFACIPIISKIGLEPKLVPMIQEYFFITGFATFGAYIHCALKEFLQGHEIVMFPNLLTIFCIFLNVGLNILFVFGYGIVPSLGVAGLAIASLITRYFMGFVLLFYCFVKKFAAKIYTSKIKERYLYYVHLLKVGLPAAFAIIIEFVGFNIITVFTGRISGIYAAAHNLMCTLTSVSFMVPLSFSMATGVKVGFFNGAKEFTKLKSYAWTGIWMSAGFMAIAAVILKLFDEPIINVFTKDDVLISVCLPIISVLCFFQIFDGLQVALSGVFRGIKSTKVVMFANLISYWIISLPVGYTLCFRYGQNLLGFWHGIFISSGILCSIMMITMIKKFRQLC